MVLTRSQGVFKYTITASLILQAMASIACADGIDALTQENVGLAGIQAYLDSTTGLQAQAELTGALQADPQFAKGSSGHAVAIKALASLRGADGMPLPYHPEQIDLLLDLSL